MQIPHRRRPQAAASVQADHLERAGSRGQSIAEFSLVVPLIAFILISILDFSRVFTAMMTIESAAREAADYGAWQATNWDGDPSDDTTARYKTEAGMTERACTASRNLWAFDDSNGNCTDNPAIVIDLLDENYNSALNNDRTMKSNADCQESVRTNGVNEIGPCNVHVTMTYEFDLIVPVGIDIGDTRLGLPQTVTLSRDSIFAITDLKADA